MKKRTRAFADREAAVNLRCQLTRANAEDPDSAKSKRLRRQYYKNNRQVAVVSAAMSRKGITTQQLSDASGVTYSLLRRWMLGFVSPRLDGWEAICTALDLELKDIE